MVINYNPEPKPEVMNTGKSVKVQATHSSGKIIRKYTGFLLVNVRINAYFIWNYFSRECCLLLSRKERRIKHTQTSTK